MKEEVQAIILGNRLIFENDRLITLFSKEKGRFNVIAKYAARSLKRFAGRLQPFNTIRAEVHFKKNLSELIDCHLEDHVSQTKESYNALLLLGYFKQIIYKSTTEFQKNTALFLLVKQQLKQLNKNPEQVLNIKSEFEKKFLICEGLIEEQAIPEHSIKHIIEDYCQDKIPDPEWI